MTGRPLACAAPPSLRVRVPGTRLLVVQLRVAGGSAVETATERGMVHAVEHLVVRTALRPVARQVHAATSRDATTYRLVLDHESEVARESAAILSASLGDLEADAVGAALTTEKDTIREERAQRLAQPAWRVQEALLGRLWRGTRYEHSPLGDPAVVERLRVEDILRVHERCYRPDSALVVTVGDFAADRTAPSATGHAAPGHVTAVGVSPHVAAAAVELPTMRGPTVRGAGFAQPTASMRPAELALARSAVRKQAGIALSTTSFGGAWTTWAVLRGGDNMAAALRSLDDGFAVTLNELACPARSRRLLEAARITELRACDDVQAVGDRAAAHHWYGDGPTALDDWSALLRAADETGVAVVVEQWRRLCRGLLADPRRWEPGGPA